MAAFNFPDPTVQQTVVNPITGSTYQWKEPPGKWVLTVSVRDVGDIIWEGDNPPNPIGDYKLWYSTDTLELYFYYCDANGVCAWVPTSVPITVLEELTEFAAQAELDIDQLQYKQQLLQVALDDIYLQVQSGAGNRPPIFSPTEPDKHPNYAPPEDELIAGDIWYDNTDPDNLEQYIYDGSHWVVYGGQFVHRKGGDEMEGPLRILNNPSIPGSRDARRIETYGVFSGSDTTALRFGTTRDRIYVGHDDTSFNGLVKIDRIAEKNAGNSVKFENDIKMGINQIKNLAEATDDKDAVTYGQVKEELEELRDKIVGEVSIGTWKFDNVSSGVTPLAGCFITKKDSNPPQISPNDINVIRISDEDVNGNPGVFDWEIGDLLTFTNVNNTAQSIKFRVNGAPANSGSYWIVSVAHITSNYDFFQNTEYYLSHINIDVSLDLDALDDTYLRLDCANDPLESELEIKTPDWGTANLSLTGKRDNTSADTATIAFKSQFDTNDNYTGYLIYRTTGKANDGFFRFNRDVDLAGNGLDKLSFARFNDNAIIYHNTNERISFKGASNASAGSGLVQFERPTSDSRRGVTIRGKNTDNEDDDLLYTYTFQIGGDAIGYKGRILNDNHITNKGYVDAKIEELLAKIEELEMTGGATKNYQFRILNKYSGGGTLGDYILPNQIMSERSGHDTWSGSDTESLTFEKITIFLCLEDGYQLNSGRMYVAEEESGYNNGGYTRGSKFAAAVISDVEKAPPEVSKGKNLYRAHIQIDGLLNDPGTNYPPSWNNNVYLYITFADGAITEVP